MPSADRPTRPRIFCNGKPFMQLSLYKTYQLYKKVVADFFQQYKTGNRKYGKINVCHHFEKMSI